MHRSQIATCHSINFGGRLWGELAVSGRPSGDVRLSDLHAPNQPLAIVQLDLTFGFEGKVNISRLVHPYKLVAQAHCGTFTVRNAQPGLEVTVTLPG